MCLLKYSSFGVIVISTKTIRGIYSMNTGDIITFDAKKNFTFIKTLGNAGPGVLT